MCEAPVRSRRAGTDVTAAPRRAAPLCCKQQPFTHTHTAGNPSICQPPSALGHFNPSWVCMLILEYGILLDVRFVMLSNIMEISIRCNDLRRLSSV